MPEIRLTRKASFCASHILHSKNLSPQENKKLFGKCNHPNGHGHNYILEVTLKGEVDPKTGILVNLTDLKETIEESVLKKVDHKHLNLDVAEFKTLNPTAENVAIVIWKWLEKKIPRKLLHEVKISETENNFAIYRGK